MRPSRSAAAFAPNLTVVLATSASEHEVTHLRAAIDADDAIDHVTTSDDVDDSKPEPDIVRAALRKAKVDAGDALFVGDTVWDIEAAARANRDHRVAVAAPIR